MEGRVKWEGGREGREEGREKQEQDREERDGEGHLYHSWKLLKELTLFGPWLTSFLEFSLALDSVRR